MRLIPFSTRQRNIMPSWNLFDDFIDSFLRDDITQNTKLMATDVIENEKQFVIKANLPGIEKKDVNISLKDNHLLIEATAETKNECKNTNVILLERYNGKYQRLITLSENCDTDKIKAKLDNGVLVLEIPKKEPIPKKDIVIE